MRYGYDGQFYNAAFRHFFPIIIQLDGRFAFKIALTGTNPLPMMFKYLSHQWVWWHTLDCKLRYVNIICNNWCGINSRKQTYMWGRAADNFENPIARKKCCSCEVCNREDATDVRKRFLLITWIFRCFSTCVADDAALLIKIGKQEIFLYVWSVFLYRVDIYFASRVRSSKSWVASERLVLF